MEKSPLVERVNLDHVIASAYGVWMIVQQHSRQKATQNGKENQNPNFQQSLSLGSWYDVLGTNNEVLKENRDTALENSAEIDEGSNNKETMSHAHGYEGHVKSNSKAVKGKTVASISSQQRLNSGLLVDDGPRVNAFSKSSDLVIGENNSSSKFKPSTKTGSKVGLANKADVPVKVPNVASNKDSHVLIKGNNKNNSIVNHLDPKSHEPNSSLVDGIALCHYNNLLFSHQPCFFIYGFVMRGQSFKLMMILLFFSHGIANKETVRALKDMVFNHIPGVLVLVETRICEDKTDGVHHQPRFEQ